MFESIYTQIMQHLALMDKVVTTSMQLYCAARNEDIHRVKLESDNRERLINIIRSLQSKVEDVITSLDIADATPELLDVLKCWSWDVNIWIEKINLLDNETMEVLASQKEKTTQEIATIYKSKEQFKGYNLNNVKK